MNFQCGTWVFQIQSEKNKILLPEQLEKDINAQSLPKLIILFPDHPKKATMESYLTRGLRHERGCEPPGNFDQGSQGRNGSY